MLRLDLTTGEQTEADRHPSYALDTRAAVLPVPSPLILDRRTGELIGFNDDGDPGATYFYDHVTGESRLLSRPYPNLDPQDLAAMTPVSIPAPGRDCAVT